MVEGQTWDLSGLVPVPPLIYQNI
uniref:Uncharacterized protein n=1 Tax=Rhizophora mucronata TaxID=61149 RepID=A0A2P2N9Q6_RHIMU